MEVSALNQPVLAGLHGPSPLLRLQSDERLIALTRRGQHAAFETLFSRYNARLLAFCRHMVGSKEDAEDVLQDVFAAAFNAVLADERPINVRPWLYRIARNRSLNHLRRASAIGVDSMDVHYADNGLSTGERVMRRESFRQLIADVQQLPESQRTALLLREMDALSYEQIAEVMETTVPSVKSLLVRARVSLAEAAEARKLSCEEVRVELGEVAEGLMRLSPPARRHVRTCTRCRTFQKQLKSNNLALAAVMPVGAFFVIRKLLFSKLGSTAGAGSAHVAGAGTAGAGAAAAGAGGTGAAGSLITAGAGAMATKAVAGLAAAALVTAGAVEADHATAGHHRQPPRAELGAASAAAGGRAQPIVVVRAIAQPTTPAAHAAPPSRPHAVASAANRRGRATGPGLSKSATTATPPPAATAATAPPLIKSATPQSGTTAGATTAKAPDAPATQLTTETAPLPPTQATHSAASGAVVTGEDTHATTAGEATAPASGAAAPAPPTTTQTTETTTSITSSAQPSEGESESAAPSGSENAAGAATPAEEAPAPAPTTAAGP